jgi:hypothetical protein
MRKLSIVVALVCALGGAGSANANTGTGPGEGDPDPGPGGDITRTLTVTPPSTGSITTPDGLINCPGDCTESYAGGTVTLSATRSGTGWSPGWSTNCTVVGSSCQVTMTLNRTVSMEWIDTGAPSVSWPSNTPTRANYNTTFTASATDAQTHITRVEFSLPGIVFEDASAPYQFKPNVDDYFLHGGTYVVTATARDSRGNTSTASHTFTMDTTAALDGLTTQPSVARCLAPFDSCAQPHVAVPPTFTLDGASDTESVTCFTEIAGNQVYDFDQYRDCTPNGTYTPTIPANPEGQPPYDGAFRTYVIVHDGLNSELYIYEWTLDRRGPSINFFTPQEGSYVTAPFTLNITGSDLSPPSVYRCNFGSGFGTCTGTHDPPEGPTTLRVESEDTLGNKRMVERSFTYDKTAPAVSITGGPADGAFTESGSVTFGWSATDAVGPLTTTCKIDQGEFASCTGGNSHSLENLNPGIHRLTLRVADAAGHETVVERLFVVPQPTNSNSTTTIINNSTTTTASGGAVGGVVGGQVETPVRLAAAARALPRWSVRGGKTQLKRLVLSGLVNGAKIQVTCKGKGCAFKKKQLTAKSAKADLTKYFKKRKLAARSRIDIRIAFGDGSVRTIRYTTQKGKKKPKVSDRTS